MIHSPVVVKPKSWSDRVLKRAREIVEWNLANPMYRDDARSEMPLANIRNRGMKIDPNTLVVVHLRHHRPELFWDATVSWRKLPPIDIENIASWTYDLFNLFLTEEELKAGEWDILPTKTLTPMVSVVAPYAPVPREYNAYETLVRRREDHERFNVNRLMGITDGVHQYPEDAGIVLA